MLAVTQKRLSFVQRHFFPCPVNLTSQTVRDIDLPVVCETNHTCIADCKLRIVRGDDTFALDRFPKFAAAVRTAGNDRVGINWAVRLGQCGWRESEIVPIPVQRQGEGTGWNIGRLVIRRRGVGEGPEEEGKDYAQ
jgi:hypothetical protein